MSTRRPKTITSLLDAVAGGDRDAIHLLWALVQEELRAIAGGKRAHERDPRAMESTALVHETFLRLFGREPRRFEDRTHFYRYAAKIMEHLLVDDAGRRKPHATLADAAAVLDVPAEELGSLSSALDELEGVNTRAADVVRLRFFAGRSEQEAADALGVARRTVQLDWTMARAWLHRRLRPTASTGHMRDP